MPTLYSGQNFWQVGPIGIFELNLTKFLFIYYFFLQEIFPFVSCSTIYAIYKFSGKNANIIFQKKLLASRAWGHFWTKFNHVFFFLGKDFLFVLGPLNMLSSICTKMLALCSYQNSCPARPEGFLEKNLTKFFSCKRFLNLYLGSLNMMSTSFGTKMPTLYSDKILG